MKTVIILGAGFSVKAGLPVQDGLMSKIDTYVTSLPVDENAVEQWNRLKAFFSSLGNKLEDYLVEDLFTIFDKCLIEDEMFRGKPVSEIEHANAGLLYVIRKYLNSRVQKNFNKSNVKIDEYRSFAEGLVRLRNGHDKKDAFSVICLNWDDVLEHTITRIISTKNTRYKKVALDYCTYDNNFSNRPGSIPSIMLKAAGKRNLKILKPHGSINWGYCSNCDRLYISYGQKIHTRFECLKYCNKVHGHISLTPLLITPTFLKNLNNTHLKNIWSNVGIEISEADRLVFVGYSLRPEDFYFRFVLSKNHKKDVEVFVYDYFNSPDPAEVAGVEESLRRKYKNFFQTASSVTISLSGWEMAINDIISTIDAAP